MRYRLKNAVISKESGNIGDLISTGLCILAMAAVLISFVDSIRLLEVKSEIDQCSRKYILEMECLGYLPEDKAISLKSELFNLGLTDISIAGTTMNPVPYGEFIELAISGRLEGKYDINVQRTTTAKN